MHRKGTLDTKKNETNGHAGGDRRIFSSLVPFVPWW
jgi:hypothetical protein